MAKRKSFDRSLDVLPDSADFRDIMYQPSLAAVPLDTGIAAFLERNVPVLDQGKAGACTGFALATVANYLVGQRSLGIDPIYVSPQMLYSMAKRYDEWVGENYDGSSARAAMKGWHKHGVCSESQWPTNAPDGRLTRDRAMDAINVPLGTYYRVNGRDLSAMHTAISEVGILLASGTVHDGWLTLKKDKDRIVLSDTIHGNHAFVIVGYDREGFYIQNSWGRDWGKNGIAHLSYGDWLTNGIDVWVAALGVPVEVESVANFSDVSASISLQNQALVSTILEDHIIPSRNDGILDDTGSAAKTQADLTELIGKTMPRTMADWAKKSVLLYAHGGLTAHKETMNFAPSFCGKAISKEIYPLLFSWKSDFFSTIANILRDALSQRRDESFVEKAKQFMIERLDDTLEILARPIGKPMWDEMKENATRSSTLHTGAGASVSRNLADLKAADKLDELHLIGFSAGSIHVAFLAEKLIEDGMTIDSMTLWGPACTVDLFQAKFQKFTTSGKIKRFRVYVLDKKTELDDNVANIYHKSLNHLVGNAFEDDWKFPDGKGEPILGLLADIEKKTSKPFWKRKNVDLIISPGTPESAATKHGGFDDDPRTIDSTFDFIQNSHTKTAAPIDNIPPEKVMARRRKTLNEMTRDQL